MHLEITWTELKTFLTDRNLAAHYIEFPNMYIITGLDGVLSFFCKLQKETPASSDQTDFETNFKPAANLSFTDSNGIPLQRTKITRTGWHYQVHGIEFCTSKLDSAFNEDKDGNDLGFCTLKFYDNTDTELVAGTQAELDANCVKTVLTWQPDQDIEVIGGVLEQATPAASDVRMWVTAIPDYTVAQGGNVPFSQGGINLRYISGELPIDGKTPKLMSHNGGIGTNKFEIVMKHNAGVITPVHMIFNLFRLNT
jgi:hypothetical protein